MNYLESTDKFFENKTSFRRRLDGLYSLFIELRTLGFENQHYSESFVSHLISKFTIFCKPDLTNEQKERFKIHILKYIDEAYRPEQQAEVVVQEQPSNEFDHEIDMIPDKQVDWEFMEMIGMEHPDE